MGGIDHSGNLFNDVRSSSDGGVSWQATVLHAPWTPRRGHAAAAAISCCDIVSVGGLAAGRFETREAQADVWISHGRGATWLQQSFDNPWGPRLELSAAFSADGFLYLAGGLGCLASGPCGYGAGLSKLELPLSDVWRSSDLGVTWQQVTAAAGLPQWAACYGHSLMAERVAGSGGALTLAAGRGPGDLPLGDVWRSADGGSARRLRLAGVFTFGSCSQCSHFSCFFGTELF